MGHAESVLATVRELGWVSLPGTFDTPWRLVAIGLYQPAPPGGSPWTWSDLQAMRAAGAATLAYLEASHASPMSASDHDAWCAVVSAARQRVIRRRHDWWSGDTDLTTPLCWGAVWLRWWIGHQTDLARDARVAIIGAVALIICACREVMGGAQCGVACASDDRRVDRLLARLDRLLERLRCPALVIAAAAAAVTSADAT
jgi:hypothetical protein